MILGRHTTISRWPGNCGLLKEEVRVRLITKGQATQASNQAMTVPILQRTPLVLVSWGNNRVRKCDLATGAARIRHALENVEIVWNESALAWNDAVSRRFREQHLDPMIPRLKLALDAIARMGLLMDELERDCES
jgi:hypothetical protein